MKTQNLDNVNIETNLNIKINMKSSNTHKLVSLLTVAEQGTFVLLLVLDKRLQDDQDRYYEDADNTVLMMKKMMTWMSTLKPSLDGHSADCVASSHFSKSKARRGKRGCL